MNVRVWAALGAGASLLVGCTRLPPPSIPSSARPLPAPAATLANEATAAQDLELHLIDVGQGDSTLVICPNGARILIDVGSKGGLNSSEKAAVGEYIRGHLANPSSPELDVLVVTHPDGDHYNLIAESLQNVAVHRVIFGGDLDRYVVGGFENWLRAFQPSGRLVAPSAGHSDPENAPSDLFDCGGAVVWILAANVSAGSNAASNFVNNTPSIVLRLAFGDFEAILTGDATTVTENAILSNYSASFLDIDVLKLGHHGSRATSTSRRWARTLSPSMAFSSASDSNNFGHPSWDVVAVVGDYTDELAHEHRVRRCAGNGGCETRDTDERIYDTSAAGTILVTSDGSGFALTCERSSGC